MTGHTWFLLVVLVVAIALLVTLINSRLRLHPFVALLVVALAAGLVAGEPVTKLAKSIETGAGDILGNVGVTLALGTMLGRLLADSGATDRIATAVVERSTPRTLPWLMALAAFIIGIPMFFEVGLIVLLPLVFSVAERLKRAGAATTSSYTLLATPTIAALATLHGMVPPHPGPLIAVSGLHADLGKTILVGFVCAVPTVILAGPVFGRWLAARLSVQPEQALVHQFTRRGRVDDQSGGMAGAGVPARGGEGAGRVRGAVPTGAAIVSILVPVVLMLLRTLAEIVLPEGNGVRSAATLLGEPVIAMLAGFLFALFALALLRGRPGEAVRRSLSDSLKPVVGILLIIGGGGAFNEVLQDSGISDAVGSAAGSLRISVLLLGWLLALLLSASTGSATVGIVSSTGIVAPLLAHGDSWYTAMVVVAIGAGSIGLNYVNHAGFWLVKESFGMSMGQATKLHTTVQTLVSVLGLAVLGVLSIFV
ncbi:GntP family permease [Amycolatopsis jiangsuensis]|uniref:GntP family gluconate:H+ symporter n=1 Tax=Amycolatopsis jiangsuensis TaxID=1181879 RepID=A0A840J0L5_9PSEU|nr:SLC13 family permease [Amycolatopsis jiangsuensis]MBB4686724.1 GntP family gluconate:H+ symporter [Amycolatopsis jiangsuensis]